MPKPVVGAALVRKGGADLIMTEKHGLKKVRRWNPHIGEWALTALGRQYFADKPKEYILSLPVQYYIDKKDRHGGEQPVHYKGWFPVSQLSGAVQKEVESATKEQQEQLGRMKRMAGRSRPTLANKDDDDVVEIRRLVIARLARYQEPNGDIVIHYESDTTVVLQPGTPRPWRFSVLTTNVTEKGDK